MYRQLSLAFCFVVITFFLQSQEVISLDSVVISASQLTQEQYKTGRSIEIIKGEDFSKYPVNTLDELLRFVSGMNINSRGAFGVQSDIGMRGSTFSQIIVLVDDVRINDPLTGHFNNNFPVAIADIDRVEIIRGPAAVSYGSDAVGGIIHIRTKTNLNRSTNAKNSFVLDRTFGQYGLVTTDAGAQFSVNKNNRFSVSYKGNKADGKELDNPNYPGVESANPTYNNHFNLNTASISSLHKLSKVYRLQTRMSYDFRRFGAKYFYTRSSFDESEEKTTNLWTQISLQREKLNSKVRLNVSFKKSTDFFSFNPLFAANDHEMNQMFFNLTHEIKFGEKTQFSYGAQLLNKEVESTDRGDHENLNLAAYAILSTEIATNLFGNVSMRAEEDENFGMAILPQASLAYKMNKTTLRASYGKSIRDADFTERYVSFNIPSLSAGRNAGNPDLTAEESNSFDLGINYNDHHINLSATGFYRTSKNLIDFSLVNSTEIDNLTNLQDSTDYFYASNISSTDVMGLELSAYRINKVARNINIKTALAYTYLETEGADKELSKYVSNHPKHNLSASIQLYGNCRFSIGVNGNYITRNEELVEGSPFEISESYFISNVMVSYSAAEHFNVYSKVFNLTNTQYQEILGAQMPGMWWSLGFRLKL